MVFDEKSPTISAYFDRNIGRCSRCMRQSFALAFLSLVGSAIVFFHGANLVLASCVYSLACGSTLLWLSHILAMAVRSTRWSLQQLPEDSEDQLTEARLQARRALFSTLAKAAGLAALMSIAPRAAFADSCSITCKDGTSASNSCSGDTPKCRCNCIASASCECTAV